MKQTKPFGRAFAPAIDSSRKPTWQREVERKEPTPREPDSAPREQLTGTHRPNGNHVAHARGAGTKVALITAALGAGLLIFFGVWIGVLESMIEHENLKQHAQSNAVSRCVDGMVVYHGGPILDRLLARGRFVCTDWRMKKEHTGIDHTKVH